ILSMQARPSGSAGAWVETSLPKACWKWSCNLCVSTVCLPCSLLTMIPVLWAVPVDAIFPQRGSRFLLCMGVEPHVCPPQRPDKNAYVERFHRTLGEECL